MQVAESQSARPALRLVHSRQRRPLRTTDLIAELDTTVRPPSEESSDTERELSIAEVMR